MDELSLPERKREVKSERKFKPTCIRLSEMESALMEKDNEIICTMYTGHVHYITNENGEWKIIEDYFKQDYEKSRREVMK